MTHTPWTAEHWEECDYLDGAQMDGCVYEAKEPGKKWASLVCYADKEHRARIVACVNFFHGRDIATEAISEGGFKEVVDALIVSRAMLQVEKQAHLERNEPDKALPVKQFCDRLTEILTKLGVEP